MRFFDFIEFNIGSEIEQRCNDFAEKAQIDSNWALNRIIAFLQYQRERTERGENTPATLSNFVKALKLFCEVSDVTVLWKKISRGYRDQVNRLMLELLQLMKLENSSSIQIGE